MPESTQDAATPGDVVRGDRQPQARVAPDKRLERDLPFDTGQGCAETDVNPLAERDMAIGIRPRDIEYTRIGEALRISVDGVMGRVVNQASRLRRPQSFFDRTSCSMALSRPRSATNRLSLLFSSSS